MELLGIRAWNSMGFHGVPWSSMEDYGDPWSCSADQQLHEIIFEMTAYDQHTKATTSRNKHLSNWVSDWVLTGHPIGYTKA